MTDVLNAGLAALIVALAVWTVVARDAFAAVVGFIAYGLLLTLVWVQLQGVDVALTEAAIGGGLTGALLVGAASRLRGTEAAARAERPRALVRVGAAALSAAVTAALAIGVLMLPDPAPTLAPQTVANIDGDRRRQSDHRGAARVSRDGHAARGHRAGVRADRRVVARAGRRVGRAPGAAPPRRPQRHPRLPRARAAADRHHRRHLHLLGRRRPPRRQVPGRDDRRRDVAAGDHGRPRRRAAGQPDLGAHRRWSAGPLVFIAIGLVGAVDGRRVPRLSGRPMRSR